MNVINSSIDRVLIDNDGGLSANSSMSNTTTFRAMNMAINFLSLAIVFITMISLGCTMEISKIKAHILKPKGVAIALLAQFFIMPLSAFCLAKVLQMDPIKAVTVLICGCCPGGTLSNIFSLIVKGDMNLSIIMTTCSTFAALGLMPLLLCILCQGFPGLQKAVPYVGIVTTLLCTLLACTIGILINHYKPKYSRIVKKTGLWILLISSITLFILSAYVVKDVLWMIVMADVLTAAALMPLIGFTLGYVLSVICKLSPQCSRTVSMETGFQNIQLCTAILKVAFPPQVIGPMFLFPLIYVAFQCSEAFLMALCFTSYRTLKPPAGDKDTNKYADAKQEEEKKQLKQNQQWSAEEDYSRDEE
uniref:Hepatic sodium/bile acid cotransporter n=1 Tax=Oryzias sinensis TaxID=183150 RepID=A0A8C7XUC4_9TELE